MGALTQVVISPRDSETPIVINEILASNTAAAEDPQGDHEDYIELKNTGARALDVSGFYLSDNPNRPKKWKLPKGTMIPAQGYLVIWADEDGSANGTARSGLHANFKLASGGEVLMLVDRDDQNNRVLETVSFGKVAKNMSWGRSPDGIGDFQIMQPSTGAANE